MKIHNPPMTFASDDTRASWEVGLSNNQDASCGTSSSRTSDD